MSSLWLELEMSESPNTSIKPVRSIGKRHLVGKVFLFPEAISAGIMQLGKRSFDRMNRIYRMKKPICSGMESSPFGGAGRAAPTGEGASWQHARARALPICS